MRTISGRIFDAGCGNGIVAARLAKVGYDVTGVDLAQTGIENANREYPGLPLEVGSLYDDLASKYGQFPASMPFPG
jgi:2-polyprenyl-3-methyl-5-hydroxy-6-metoxy-1,4-benzoquinol methylase